MRQRRCPKIQLCPTCGNARGNHLRGPSDYDCPVPREVTLALRAFRENHGRRWKSILRALWNKGDDTGLLRQARNMIGPMRLDKINLARSDLPSDDEDNEEVASNETAVELGI